MKLVELLDVAMKTGNILHVSSWALGIRYCEQLDCFIYCFPETGLFVKDNNDSNGYKKVILAGKKLLNNSEWKMFPIPQKYNIGDKFIIPEITKVITEYGVETMKQCNKNIVGEIIDIHNAEDDGCDYFTLKLECGCDTIP